MNGHRWIVGAVTGAALVLAGCTGALQTPASEFAREVTARQLNLPTELPPMKAFNSGPTLAVARSNGEVASDFLDLSFQLESGRALPVMSRFEGPVTVKVSGRKASVLDSELDQLIGRLRTEAGIDISRYTGQGTPSITLEVIPKRQLQALVPGAACFVAPNVSGWRDYKSNRRSPRTDWTKLQVRTQMSVFIPGDVAPQEMRDCLHEEVAQSLGPVNDLYRLADSVFNDDNFHTVLTGFDMLILRAYYSPELSSGMTREQVAARLPGLLARLNPSGGMGYPVATSPTPRSWKAAIETALSANESGTQRRKAAGQAVDLARAYGWNDTRLAFSLFALGRLNLGINSDVALAAFREAEAIYGALPGTRLQAAHMGVQLAAHALSLGNADTAIRIVDNHMPAVRSAQNAALLSTLLMIKAEGLEILGRDAEAHLVRLDSLGWARYGFGSDAEVGQRLLEIAAISPIKRG